MFRLGTVTKGQSEIRCKMEQNISLLLFVFKKWKIEKETLGYVNIPVILTVGYNDYTKQIVIVLNCLYSKCLWFLSQTAYYCNASCILQTCPKFVQDLVIYPFMCLGMHIQYYSIYGIHGCQLGLWQLRGG